ncbi:MAG: hypothetical protein MUC99_11745 [Anaerolineae bacterium]|nr:hypothetical protein [Anaerolineae bacterium]
MTLNDLLSHGALADIDSLTELKVTVFCVWAFAQHDAPNGLRWVRRADFDAPNQALHGLTPDELDDGLRRAVQRGTLLHTCARTPSGETDLYLAPTPEALALLDRLQAVRGQHRPPHRPDWRRPARPLGRLWRAVGARLNHHCRRAQQAQPRLHQGRLARLAKGWKAPCRPQKTCWGG